MPYNRITAFILSSILLFTSIPASETAEAASERLTITATSLNVRQGPGLSYPVAGSVRKGEKFSIVEEKGDWLRISIGGGKSGWVAEWFTERDKPSSQSAPVITNSHSGLVQADGLRVRKGPGTNFQVIGSLNKGNAVEILDSNEQWAEIRFGSIQGWVSKSFLQAPSEKNSGSSKGEQNTKKSAIVTADSLNVREEPALGARKLGSLKKGSVVEVLHQSNGWTSITYTGKKAWVSSQFLKEGTNQQENQQEKPSPSESKYVGKVTASSLNVRENYSLDSKVIGSVSKGESFQIVEEINNWVQIEYQPGKMGWAAGWFFEKTKTGPAAPPKQSTQNSSVKILYNGTNIRKGPSTSTAVIHRANQGDSFGVKNLKNDWYEVSLPDGKTGYVAGWIVSMVGSAPQIEKPGAEKHTKNKTIILDPGHGGRDYGTTGIRGTLEKTLTLRTAELLYDKLKASGTNVILTRNNDSYISLSSRVSTAQYHSADAFISLHYDSINDRSVRGMTTYYYHSSQKPLGEQIHSAVINRTKLKDRGTRFGNYHVIRENKQKSVLLELGFLSNPAEEMLVNTSQYQESVANGIFEGLARYFKNN